MSFLIVTGNLFVPIVATQHRVVPKSIPIMRPDIWESVKFNSISIN